MPPQRGQADKTQDRNASSSRNNNDNNDNSDNDKAVANDDTLRNGTAKPSGIAQTRPQPLASDAGTSSSRDAGMSLAAPGQQRNRRPPSLLSSSPSTRSISGLSPIASAASSTRARGSPATTVAQGSNYAHLGGSGGGAVNKLRRVASNASIAGSIRTMMGTASARETEGEAESSPAKQDVVRDSERVEGLNAASTGRHAQTTPAEGSTKDAEHSTLTPPEAKTDYRQMSGSSTLTKRPSTDQDTIRDSKQARRRTWFGFGAPTQPEALRQREEGTANKLQDDPEGGATGIEQQQHSHSRSDGNSEAPALDDKCDTQMQPLADTTTVTTDGPDPSNTTAQASSSVGAARSWLPWRGSGEQQSPTEQLSRPAPAPPSYTDTIRRYVGWTPQTGGKHMETSADERQDAKTRGPSHSADRQGWFTWRGGSEAVQSLKSSPNEELASREQQTINNAEEQASQPSQPREAQAQEARFVSRWIPYWSQTQDGSADPKVLQRHEGECENSRSAETSKGGTISPPKTPAEQYKTESLARLSAKDAILNGATKSTWINYFATRRAAAPDPRMQQSPDEPEIMRIETRKTKAAPSTSEQKKGVGPSTKSMTATKSAASQRPSTVPPKVDDQLRSKESGRESPAAMHADPAPPTSRPMTPLTSDKNAARPYEDGGKKGKGQKTTAPAPPNLLLPTFDDVFSREPRNLRPRQGMLEKTLSFLFPEGRKSPNTSREQAREETKMNEAQLRLPRLWSIVGDRDMAMSRGCKRVQKVTVIGIHGWFSQGPLRNLFGEPTGTSVKFSTMMREQVKRHFEEAGHPLDDKNLTSIALEASGKVSDRVDKYVEN